MELLSQLKSLLWINRRKTELKRKVGKSQIGLNDLPQLSLYFILQEKILSPLVKLKGIAILSNLILDQLKLGQNSLTFRFIPFYFRFYCYF